MQFSKSQATFVRVGAAPRACPSRGHPQEEAPPDGRSHAAGITAADLHARYLKDVFRYVLQRVSSIDEAEDITAEVFAAAAAGLPSFRGQCPPYLWLLSIARRQIARAQRRRAVRRETLSSELAAEGPEAQVLWEALAAVEGPEAALMRAEARRMLAALVAQLRADQREALLLQYMERLARWAARRRQHGALMLDDVVEIAQLSDAQLDAAEMAEGARECWGLAEWRLACYRTMRPHLRFLAQLTPAQRQETTSATGLPFTRMSLAQQQQFVSSALGQQPLRSLQELDGAALRVDYTLPGGFQWGNPGMNQNLQWVVPMDPGPQGRRVLRPPVREETREAALQSVRRVDPKIREALLQAMRRNDPRVDAAPPDEEAQIFPTRLGMVIVYIPGATNARPIYVLTEDTDLFLG
jgi:RNA polymerase sigma factor (sigma-70 family)